MQPCNPSQSPSPINTYLFDCRQVDYQMEHPGGKPEVEKDRPPVAEDSSPEEVALNNPLEEVAEENSPEEAGQQSPLDCVGSILVVEGMVLKRTHGNQVMKNLIQVYNNMATELKTRPHLLQYDEEKFNTTDYWTSTMDIHEHKKMCPKFLQATLVEACFVLILCVSMIPSVFTLYSSDCNYIILDQISLLVIIVIVWMVHPMNLTM